MFRTVLLTTVIVAQSVSGCVDNLGNALPTSPGETAFEGFSGSWASVAASTAAQVCTDFRWAVTEVTTNGAAGTWTARCFQAVPISGTASASLVNGEVRWTATGTGTAEKIGACPVDLTGTARLNDSQVRIAYTGTTCLGTVSGTEILRK